MNKLIYILTLLFFAFFYCGFSQNQTKNRKGARFVTYEVFKEKFKPTDSIGFTIWENDTLIKLTDYKPPKGVPVPYEFKDSTFLEVYKKIAFNIIHKDSINTKPMKYWKDDIRIFFSKSISKSVVKDFMNFAKKIDSEVDSLQIYQVKKLEQSNYIIYHNDNYEYEPSLRNYKRSSYWVYWNKKNQLNRAYLRIDKNNMFTEKLEIQKIKDLFFGSLGRFRLNNELSCDSYFSNCYSDNKQLSQFDLELLKYHYSYGICKGTRKKTFETQHKQSKEVLKKHGAKVLFYHDD